MLILAAAAPWFGVYAKLILIVSLSLYAISNCFYVAAWFPLLDSVVREEDRGPFLGTMRFCWQMLAGLFVFSAGWFVGKDAPLGAMQIVVALPGLMLLMRWWYVKKVPEMPVPPPLGFKALMQDILANGPLTGFSIYLFFLYTSASATAPVFFVFAKNQLGLADNLVVILSSCAMAGLIMGFPAGGFFVQRYGIKRVFFTAHLCFVVINLLLLFIHSDSLLCVVSMITLLTINGFAFACASIAVSSEMMALSPPNNKSMSIAFCFSFYSAGLGFSRLLASMILGSGILAPTWKCFGTTMTSYHTLFLFFGCGVLMTTVLLVTVPAFIKDVKRLPNV